ncbi:MAG TPA: hypothetical protein VJR89_43160 [Polyangiales bacterium]|nr:hypothetical protein [Polyangiales bacterium]
MITRTGTTWVAMLFTALAACAADETTQPPGTPHPGSAGSTSQLTGATAGRSAPDAGSGKPDTNQVPAAGSGGNGPGGVQPVTTNDGCDARGSFKPEGCPCRAGETAACWTGPAADRNVGMCHDGLQICTGGSEFASWGPCMGEQKMCETDAGVPPPPPPPGDCPCVPGAVIQCSEDCSVGIICSLTATKTCLPDGTWSTCREDLGVELDLPGIQCRNMLHGCFNLLTPDMPAASDGELYVGDCSKQFKCGRAPTIN